MMIRLLIGVVLAWLLAMPATRAQTPSDTPPPAPAASPALSTPAPVETPSSGETPAPVETPAPQKSKRFRLGPEIGYFVLTSNKARDQFGSSSISLGLGLGSIEQIKAQGTWTFDLQVLYQTHNGNHLFLAPVGVGYRKALSQSGPNVAYVGATADVYFADLRSGDYNVHSGIRTGFGGSPVVGVNFGDSGFVEARYLIVSRIKGFDLSGFNLSAGYRF